MTNQAQEINNMFICMAQDYGYEGELHVDAKSGELIRMDHIIENIVRLIEHRFDDEMKIIREQLGLKKP